MQVTVNGNVKELRKGSTLGDAVKGEAYVPGSLISVHMSTEKLIEETNDFEIMTTAGRLVLHLDDDGDAEVWRHYIASMEGLSTRWATQNIVAFGAFSTDIKVDRTERRYRKYDCFFSLGGYDNHTTYMMIAKDDHKREYGAGPGRIGRITVGRHILKTIREGESIISVKPLMSEISKDNVLVTTDLKYPVEADTVIETNLHIKLDIDSPQSVEQVLIVGAKGYMNVTDETGSYIGCRDEMDVEIADERQDIRERGSVAVRNKGLGCGHVIVYKDKRQLSLSHNIAGTVDRGTALILRAKKGEKITVTTEPPRTLAVGMTQSEGEKYLSGMGVKQKRTGDTSDDAVIADQTPERTMEALKSGEVETFGVSRDKLYRIELSDKDPVSNHYFRRMTGLSHKPIGYLKAQFAFPGMPMVTFYGDEERSKSLYPQEPFKKCKKGEIGVTNQSRPHHGLIGVRLADSKEYGPTGEEPYGTNIIGKFISDVSKLGELEDEDIIYITEEKE